jgi:hypothetical protein
MPQHEIGHDALLRADIRGRARVHIVARVSTVVICAIALAGCGCTTRTSMISQTANSKKVTQSKNNQGADAAHVRKEPLADRQGTVVLSDRVTRKFTASKSRTLIPLPAAPLLSPQPEPRCKFEATESNADERQKLDYERQCYRHAEMIVRSRLQLLQASVDKTISAVKRGERGGPGSKRGIEKCEAGRAAVRGTNAAAGSKGECCFNRPSSSLSR